MESNVDELGKLKYSLALEISFQEIKPTYDAIFKELKNTRHNGFRRGKHPKGWLEKRFLTVMQREAVDNVIPGYMENALKKHSLKPVTMPIIKKIEFNRSSPLLATLDFEIAPELPKLDYTKIKLERKEMEVLTEEQISDGLENLIKQDEVLVPKQGDFVKVQNNDWVKVNYEGNIKGNQFADSKANDVQFMIGGPDFVEFHESLIGMAVGDEKIAEIIMSDRFRENEGEKANFNVRLLEISVVKKPEIDDKYFEKYDVKNLDELREKVGESINARKKAEIQTEYRMAISGQLPDLYDEFDLPEQLIEFENEKIKKELEKVFGEENIPEEEKEKKLKEGFENVKKDLRKKFILDSISDHEKLIFDENEAAREFVNLAQMTGQSPDKLIQSGFGREMYQRIIARKRGDLTLDRIIARILGDPIDHESVDIEKHVHDENCENTH